MESLKLHFYEHVQNFHATAILSLQPGYFLVMASERAFRNDSENGHMVMRLSPLF